MKTFIFLIFLFTFQFVFIINRKINKKYLILFLLNPILYLFFPNFIKYFCNIKKRIQNQKDRRKQMNEIPKLIEQLKSYLKSGVQTSQAVLLLSKKNRWSASIQNSLSQITGYYSQGMSFESSISMVISSLPNHKHNHFLLFFLSSLRLGHLSGGNMVSILENVKSKIENSILLNHKIRSTTAQMRLQAIIISIAPIALALIIWIISPSYILFFFENEIGNVLFVIMLLLNAIGFYFLKLISRLN